MSTAAVNTTEGRMNSGVADSTHQPKSTRHPKNGERRLVDRVLRLDRLPLALLDRIRSLRSTGRSWEELEKDSPGWPEWQEASPDVLEQFPDRRLPHTSMQRWYDLRVRQMLRDRERYAIAAEATAKQITKHPIYHIPALLEDSLVYTVFALMDHGQSLRQQLLDLAMVSKLVVPLEREQRADSVAELNRQKHFLAVRQSEIDLFYKEAQMDPYYRRYFVEHLEVSEVYRNAEWELLRNVPEDDEEEEAVGSQPSAVSQKKNAKPSSGMSRSGRETADAAKGAGLEAHATAGVDTGATQSIPDSPGSTRVETDSQEANGRQELAGSQTGPAGSATSATRQRSAIASGGETESAEMRAKRRRLFEECVPPGSLKHRALYSLLGEDGMEKLMFPDSPGSTRVGMKGQGGIGDQASGVSGEGETVGDQPSGVSQNEKPSNGMERSGSETTEGTEGAGLEAHATAGVNTGATPSLPVPPGFTRVERNGQEAIGEQLSGVSQKRKEKPSNATEFQEPADPKKEPVPAVVEFWRREAARSQ